MSSSEKAGFACLLFLLIPCLIKPVFALEINDGFGSTKRVGGRHFEVYYSPQINPDTLIEKLDISPSERMLARQEIKSSASSYENELADDLDTLFKLACDVLDMRLYSFQGKVKICLNRQQLNDIYLNLFNKDLKANSFYVYALNTIYVSPEGFSRGLVGHEIAHAIISHYFVVQPSVKIQEVLAGYVEYQLRRAQ